MVHKKHSGLSPDELKKLREVWNIERQIEKLEDAEQAMDEAGFSSMDVNTSVVQKQNEIDKLRKKYFGSYEGYVRANIAYGKHTR